MWKTKEMFGKTNNCSDIGNVLNEQQNPLSVGLSANNSVHLYLMPNQWHSKIILSQVCITYEDTKVISLK